MTSLDLTGHGKSILCQENTYLLELVRYIHLNPIRAGIVKDLKSLDRYTYTGHSIIMGKRKNPWQDIDSVLQLFGKSQYAARKKYRDFVEKGIGRGRNPEMTGGGLLRSIGGWGVLKSMRKMNIHIKGDERILGDSDFVEKVLSQASEQMERRYWLKA
ncbi:MAG: transposase, partial [Actinomycetia bacterium]|nr:transposase [Actinomycetes bacterium]